MSAWPRVPLGEIFEIARGGSPRPIDHYITYAEDGVNWISIADASDSDKYIERTKRRIRPEGVARSRLVAPGDFLLTNSMSFGRPYIMRTSGCIHDGWLVLGRKREGIDQDFFFRLLGSEMVYASFSSLAAGATVKNLNIDLVKSVTVPVPPLDEQRRIAAILDQADALRGQRQKAITELDKLTQAVFVEMFGDPASNHLQWPTIALGQTAEKFSDGPFGSNLKSSHYTESGVRVIRLQNIGIGDLVDNDRAFVSDEHFRTLRKHECLPGDVLIATMGDPNLRACIQPAWIEIALNKADCVQLRPRRDVANARYLCALLNHPSVEGAAQELMTGQTRVRISMGRLRGLRIPLPPISLQNEFDARMSAVDSLKATYRAAFAESDALFASLQHRAFSGAL